MCLPIPQFCQLLGQSSEVALASGILGILAGSPNVTLRVLGASKLLTFSHCRVSLYHRIVIINSLHNVGYTWPDLGMNLATPNQLTLQRTMPYHCSLLKSLLNPNPYPLPNQHCLSPYWASTDVGSLSRQPLLSL